LCIIFGVLVLVGEHSGWVVFGVRKMQIAVGQAVGYQTYSCIWDYWDMCGFGDEILAAKG